MTKVYVKFEGYRDDDYLDGYVTGVYKTKGKASEKDGVYYLEYELKE